MLNGEYPIQDNAVLILGRYQLLRKVSQLQIESRDSIDGLFLFFTSLQEDFLCAFNGCTKGKQINRLPTGVEIICMGAISSTNC